MPQRFVLVRKADVSGVSGVGIVADGWRLPGGWYLLRWRAGVVGVRSWGLFTSRRDLLAVHGHQGRTRLYWWG